MFVIESQTVCVSDHSPWILNGLLSSQCFQNKTSAVASDGNFYICDAYFHSGKFPK